MEVLKGKHNHTQTHTHTNTSAFYDWNIQIHRQFHALQLTSIYNSGLMRLCTFTSINLFAKFSAHFKILEYFEEIWIFFLFFKLKEFLLILLVNVCFIAVDILKLCIVCTKIHGIHVHESYYVDVAPSFGIQMEMNKSLLKLDYIESLYGDTLKTQLNIFDSNNSKINTNGLKG